jgi:hypothetical protein
LRKRLYRSRKAVSGIIGGVFFITILFVSFNVMIWYYGQQSNLYSQGAKAQQLAQQSLLESFQIQQILLPSGHVNATIKNTGSVTIHIVHIAITSRSDSPMWHKIYNSSYFINPGSSATNVGYNEIVNTPTALSTANTYTVTFITERGNAETGTYTPTAITSGAYETFGNLGYLTVSFTPAGFQYTSENQLTPQIAWQLSYNYACYYQPNIIWLVVFTNHGMYDATIKKWSGIEVFPLGNYWYGDYWGNDFWIVDSGSTPNHITSYTSGSHYPQIIPASTTGDWQTGGTPVTLLFGADSVNDYHGQSLTWGSYYCGTNDVFELVIMVTYTYNGQEYTQVIPFGGTVVNLP